MPYLKRPLRHDRRPKPDADSHGKSSAGFAVPAGGLLFVSGVAEAFIAARGTGLQTAIPIRTGDPVVRRV